MIYWYNFLPAYHLLYVAVSYRNEKFNITLNVYNITNTNYAAMGSYNASTNEWQYTPGEPVNFRLSVGINLIKAKKD
jgi:outer membrane receptor for monomeric catechols